MQAVALFGWALVLKQRPSDDKETKHTKWRQIYGRLFSSVRCFHLLTD